MTWLKVQLLSWMWSVVNPLTGYRLAYVRCDGYRPCGPDADGWRTHMAQYCLRLRHRRGRCLAKTTYDGQRRPAYFTPDPREEWA